MQNSFFNNIAMSEIRKDFDFSYVTQRDVDPGADKDKVSILDEVYTELHFTENTPINLTFI